MKKRYKAALFLPAAAAAYFLAAWTLSSFRVNDRQSGGEITLFLVSNCDNNAGRHLTRSCHHVLRKDS